MQVLTISLKKWLTVQKYPSLSLGIYTYAIPPYGPRPIRIDGLILNYISDSLFNVKLYFSIILFNIKLFLHENRLALNNQSFNVKVKVLCIPHRSICTV